jgi:hypothetical protein
LDGHCLVRPEPGEVGEWSELWCYQLFEVSNFLGLTADGHDYLPNIQVVIHAREG